MPDVVKHAWTHRPRSQGGTDPIEVTATAEPLKWATATMFQESITKAGGFYRPRFHTCGTNDPSLFELTDIAGGSAGYLAINAGGFYVCYFSVSVTNVQQWGANYTIMEPIFNDGGGDEQINVGANYESDWVGAVFNRANEQFADEAQATTPDHQSLFDIVTINYDPGSGNGDFSFLTPLEIAARVRSNQTADRSLVCQVHVEQFSTEGGYTLQDVT